MPSRNLWSQNELLIALNIYHKLSFGQMHARQPLIIEVAEKLGRSPGSLAMKLVNLASLDPVLKLRGISGLSRASHLDQEMWTEFHARINEMAPASEEALRLLYEVPSDCEIDVLPKTGVKVRRHSLGLVTEANANVKVRRGQEFFREAVVNNFGGQCGVSKLDLRELLIASHILPWSTHPSERLNIANGLCLSRLHDAAFDQGLITFGDSFDLMLSGRLRSRLGVTVTEDLFGKYEGRSLHLPVEAVRPSSEFLSWHRKELFDKAA
jgi:putative restriction endonuclease